MDAGQDHDANEADANIPDANQEHDASIPDASQEQDASPQPDASIPDASQEHDSGQEADASMPPDASIPDASQEQDASTIPDASQDQDASTPPDASLPVCPGATTGTFSNYLNVNQKQVVGGYGFIYTGLFNSSTALFSIVCDSNSAPIQSGIQCQLDIPTTYVVQGDGRTAKIDVTQIGAFSIYAGITVQ